MAFDNTTHQQISVTTPNHKSSESPNCSPITNKYNYDNAI